MLKRKLILTGILIVLAVGFVIFQLVRGGPALVIENRSGQRIKELEVRVGKEKETFRNVKNGADRSVMLKVKDGDTLLLKGELENGDVVHGRIRVSSGSGLYAVIRPGGLIEIRQGKQ